MAFVLVLLPAVSFSAISFEPPVTYTIKNGPAQRVLGVQDGVLAHTAVTRSTDGKIAYVKGHEFAIRLKYRWLYPRDFKVTGAVQQGPGSLDLELRTQDPPLTVLLHYRQDKGSHFIRKWLTIKPDPGTKVFIDSIVMERFEPWAEPRTFHGPGQPVYVDHTFWSVAYPSSQNRVGNGMVTCSFLVGLSVYEDGYVTPEAVHGLSGPGPVRDSFLQCVDEMRARPATPFLLWNTWYHLRHFSADEVISTIRGLKRNLVDPYGVRFDSVVLDSGWDDYHDLWRPHPERFPEGFGPVKAAARELGADLGLWMSPLGGYVWRQWARLFWSMGEGYERSWQGFCIAGDDYNRLFAGRMTEYIKEYNVNYYKLDNLTTSCPAPWHGHRIGRYGQVGLTDAFIRVMEETRRAAPDVMINITRGAWMSPWWLLYADVVWRGGMDYGSRGEGSRRQRSITYVDSLLYKRLRDEEAQFPLSSVMTHGIIKGAYQSLGEEGENLRDFSDDAWMYFGRGVAMWELYLSPELISESEWEVLAQAIRFSRDNWELLADSEMVLGDPASDEVYGFFHKKDESKLLVIRNPGESEAPFPGEAADLIPRGGGACSVVYSSVNRGASDPLSPLEARLVLCKS